MQTSAQNSRDNKGQNKKYNVLVKFGLIIHLKFYKIVATFSVCILSPSLLTTIILPFVFSSASTLSAFSFNSPEQRGQLLIPDKRLAFGTAREGREGLRRNGGRAGLGCQGVGVMGVATSMETARSEKGSED